MHIVVQKQFVYYRNMDAEPSMAAIGALIGSPARAAILAELYDGRSLTATELALVSRVAPATASEHLSKLAAAKLIICEVHGRHRYYRLASARVAEILEPLIHLSPVKPVPMRNPYRDFMELKDARLCYDHFAGTLGVLITDALVQKQAIRTKERDFELTKNGEDLLTGIGVDVESARSKRRVFARQCLDWSERRPHLAGALGAAIAVAFLKCGWVERTSKRRQVKVTQKGLDLMQAKLGVRFEAN